MTRWPRVTALIRGHRGLTALLIIPFAVFGLPVAFGRSFLDGDNFLQNFPLRVLVGEDLRHGHLPLVDPYIFGGAPLLAGFNAGAAYPLTWLFAVLPSQIAWLVNLSFPYDVAVLGMYLFLRRQPMSQTAATFGAAAFAFAGYMSGQIVHIDLISSASWLPWILCAVHALTRRPAGTGGADIGGAGTGRCRQRWWAAGLAVAVGLSVTAGGVEAIIDGGVLVAIYLAWRVVTERFFRDGNVRSSLHASSLIIGGLVGAVALSAAQWLPGLAFVSQSQRAVPTYAFFSSGSLQIRLFSLVASPFAFGTNQNVPVPYLGTYNFPEVTSYVGVLALIAACSLFAARWRRRPEARSWWIWYVVLIVGALSAFGAQTPFGHLMFAIPGVKDERLLNRNLLLVDFSLAVLFAWWVHVLLDSHRPENREDHAGAVARPTRRRWTEQALACIPLAVITVLCVAAWVLGARFATLFGGSAGVTASQARWIAGCATVGLAIAGVATWVVLTEGRHTLRRLHRLLTAVFTADLVFFSVLVVHLPLTMGEVHANTPFAARLSSIAANGRFVIYDPDQFHSSQLFSFGRADTNILRHQPDGQGYAALVGQRYYRATGAHRQENLNPSTLAGPVWDNLDTRVLLSLPSYFLTPVPGQRARRSRRPATNAARTQFPSDKPESYTGWPTPVIDRVPLAPGATYQWYFGGVRTVDWATIPIPSGSPGDVAVGLVTATGATRWLPTSVIATSGTGAHRSVTIALGSPTVAAGLVVRNPARSTATTSIAAGQTLTVGVPMVRTVEDGSVLLDGRLQYGVHPPHWRFTGMLGSFGIFVNTRAGGWAFGTALGGGAPPAGTVVVGHQPQNDGTQTVSVHATGPVRIVVSAAWSPGWRATVRSMGAGPRTPATSGPVGHSGPLQALAITKAGDYQVTLTYRPTVDVVGIAVSTVTALALGLWALLAAVAVTRRRRGQRLLPPPLPTPPVPPTVRSFNR